jgi:hypothetical protein
MHPSEAEVLMSQMVRKQIYIRKRQQAVLKRLARARGVSEAELIREAIDRQLAGRFTHTAQPDAEALDKALEFMRARRAQGGGRPYQWKREDAYEERLGRYERKAQH